MRFLLNLLQNTNNSQPQIAIAEPIDCDTQIPMADVIFSESIANTNIQKLNFDQEITNYVPSAPAFELNTTSKNNYITDHI